MRNAHGVIHDVNENFVQRGGSRPRRRYQYAYALFSASGFTHPAQDYALAQQISLVDLSGESFAWLRDAISSAAADLYGSRNQYHVARFPVSWMRSELRAMLGTAALADQALEADGAHPTSTNAPRFRTAAQETLAAFGAQLRERSGLSFSSGSRPRRSFCHSRPMIRPGSWPTRNSTLHMPCGCGAAALGQRLNERYPVVR